MKSVNTSYRKMLQRFICLLISDADMALELKNEEDVIILELEILNAKKTVSEKRFYYCAGKAYQLVLNEVFENLLPGAVTESLEGYFEFEKFIALDKY